MEQNSSLNLGYKSLSHYPQVSSIPSPHLSHSGHGLQVGEENGYKFITGAFLDRIGEGGRFPKIEPFDDSDIWKEFPLAGSFRLPVSNACPNKTVVMKGDIQITNGQHYAMIDGHDTYGDRWNHSLRYPVDKCFIQVHHFKWDITVIGRCGLPALAAPG